MISMRMMLSPADAERSPPAGPEVREGGLHLDVLDAVALFGALGVVEAV